MAAAPKNTDGEVEANPAQKYEEYSGAQRVGADVGTAYPITGEPPKAVTFSDPPEGNDPAASDEAIAAAEKQAKADKKKS